MAEAYSYAAELFVISEDSTLSSPRKRQPVFNSLSNFLFPILSPPNTWATMLGSVTFKALLSFLFNFPHNRYFCNSNIGILWLFLAF